MALHGIGPLASLSAAMTPSKGRRDAAGANADQPGSAPADSVDLSAAALRLEDESRQMTDTVRSLRQELGDAPDQASRAAVLGGLVGLENINAASTEPGALDGAAEALAGGLRHDSDVAASQDPAMMRPERQRVLQLLGG